MAAVRQTSLKSLSPAQRRAHAVRRQAALRPIAWAVAIAFPVSAGAVQYGPSVPSVVTATLPSRTQLPVPIGTVNQGQIYSQTTNSGNRGQWLQYGSSSLVQNGSTQNIYQTTQRGIYNWASFDVGADASVNFFFTQANPSALNRVPNAANPSVIMGHVNSYLGTTIDAPKGGDVYLINGAGILFGRGSQVNVGGLIAATLDLDDADYLSGFANSLSHAVPTFKWAGTSAISTFDHPSNYVQVDPEAEITTASGGRVYLLAKRVENNGTIRTPDKGQTVLASGSEVYLQDPSAEKMYASEASDKVAALNGFLVEVGGNGNGVNAGATNNGLIEALRGNVTIVGMAVNQNGRINATTGVADRGSVFLLARGKTTAAISGDGITKRATEGGTLTLGEGSVVAIAPQLTYTNGEVDKVDGNGYFTKSRVELSGHTIEMKDGAQIVAPGAVVNALAFANAAPTVKDSALTLYTEPEAVKASDARITIGSGATIDVSGATTAEASVADFFVMVRRAGINELKDAPLQKSGILYHEKLVFDARNATPIIGDTSSYLNSIGRTADNWLASGGQVTLATDGAVLTHAQSSVNVSGGQVAYAGAQVSPTVVVSSTGKRYTLSTAPTDLEYVAVASASSPKNTRFGPSPQASAGSDTYFESGYVEGKSAGSFTVLAPQAALDGSLTAKAVAGRRQLTGVDALAKGGTFQLGVADGVRKVAVMRDLVIAEGQVLSDEDWKSPLTAKLPDHSQISASVLNHSGINALKVYVDGGIVQQAGADLMLAEKSTVNMQAAGSGGIALNGNIVTHGGSVTAAASLSLDGSVGGGALTLASGSTVDVSGTWVNLQQDPSHKVALAGGAVTLKAARDLVLSEGSTIDVSGGATLNTAGTKATATDAGAITLSAAEQGPSTQTGALQLGGALLGYSGAQGGALSVSANRVQVLAPQGRLTETASDGTLKLSADFFKQNGFSNYTVDGRVSLAVQGGAELAPAAQSWVVGANAARVATDSRPTDAMVVGDMSLALRKPTNLSLKSSGAVPGGVVIGDLSVAEGARINAEAGASVSLTAGRSLTLDGRITAAGGTVNLTQVRSDNSSTSVGALTMGAASSIDVSGATVLRPISNGVQRGTVQDGGTINIDGARNSGQTINLKAGSSLLANGTVGTVDIDAPAGASANTTPRRTTLATQGGSVNVAVGGGGAVLAADMQAHGGDAGVADGSFSLAASALTGAQITVQSGIVSNAPAVAGQSVVSAQTLSNGFDSVTLKAGGAAAGKVTFVDSNPAAGQPAKVSLNIGKALTVDAATIQADAVKVELSANSTLVLGSSDGSKITLAASGGTSTLALKSGLVELMGKQSLQGIGTVTADAGTELRLVGAGNSKGTDIGLLDTRADITFTAPQVVAASHATYTINASGHRFAIEGGDRSLAKPLSAGASLTVNAADIVQDGVLLAPFGQITFNATRITLGAQSLTSVSGAGLTVPYGYIQDGDWKVSDSSGVTETLTQLREKSISLNAPGQSVVSQTGSLLDLSGGGDVVASQFVPGAGGSKDIFAGSSNGSFAIVPTVQGYAPTDSTIAASVDSGGKKTAVQLGQQITFGAGGPVPAGTYTILPARYALLDGAYLIQPSTKANLAQGFALKQQDGSYLVGATRSTAGTRFIDAQPSTYRVLSSALARTYSEVRSSNANDYFTTLAQKSDQIVSRLPQDGGTLNIAANRLTLGGQALFNLPNAASRGGEANFAGNVHVGDTPLASGDTMELTGAQLSNIGAQSVLLGGSRSQSSTGERVVTTSASKVVIDGSAKIEASDIILTSTDLIDVQSGASLQASGSVAAQSVSLSNNGASLRVSSDANVGVSRNYSADANGYLLDAKGKQVLVNGKPVKAGDSGTLAIGANVVIGGASVSAEVSKSLAIADSAALNAADRFTLGARRFAVGDTSGVSASDLNGAQVLSAGLAQTLQNSKQVTLKATDAVDLYGNAKIGGAAQRALTIDTQLIAVKGNGAVASVEAGQVTLTNTSGASSSVAPKMAGSGASLTVEATGGAGGSGQLTLGPGAVALTGTDSIALKAAADVQTKSTAIQGDGQLTLVAQRVTGARATDSSVTAAGALIVQSNGSTAAASVAESGAALRLSGSTIVQAGKIELPSGSLTLKSGASGMAADAEAIRFAAGSSTDLSGRSTIIDGQVINAQGGQLTAQAVSGGITLAGADAQSGAGAALINVSGGRASAAASATGRAGSVTLSTPTGEVKLDGRLVGLSGSGASGGSIAIDSLHAVDLNKLAAAMAAEQSGALKNFAGSISARNRLGDQGLAAGSTLASQQVLLVADAGTLTVAGQIDASGASGGQISLAAGQNLTVTDGALLDAHATQTGHDGGEVMLASTAGRISLQGGVINVAGGGDLAAGQTRTGETGANGTVVLRAQRTSNGKGVLVDDIKTQVSGARAVYVDAVKTYQVADDTGSSFDAALQAGLGDAATFGAKTNTDAIVKSLTQSQSGLASALAVRPDVELQSSGDITSDQAVDIGSSGKPVSLTVRATGNLTVNEPISNGFSGDDPAAASGAVRLVAGADLNSADLLATLPAPAAGSLGDISINGVAVRTTTGGISIAAANNVALTGGAAIYTTGLALTDAQMLGDYSMGFLYHRPLRSNPFLTGGGRVLVRAGNDVSAQADGSQSWWMFDGADTSMGWSTNNWWAEYATGDDLASGNVYPGFTNGVGAFGGGAITVDAGRDVVSLNVANPESGYVGYNNAADAAQPSVVQRFGGGAIAVSAGRDVLGGHVFSGGGAAQVAAGRDLGADAAGLSLSVTYTNSQLDLSARRNLQIGSVQQAGWDFDPIGSFALDGLGGGAKLAALAAGGDLSYAAASNAGIGAIVMPNSVDLLAPAGSVNLTSVLQASSSEGHFSALAGSNLSMTGSVKTVTVSDDSSFGPQITYLSADNRPRNLLGDAATTTRLVADGGDINQRDDGAIMSQSPLRVIAGRDINNIIQVSSVHNSPDDVTLIEAGRDIVARSGFGTFMTSHGGGNVVVAAGRNIQLGTTDGVLALGNTADAELPRTSAGITMLAGVSLSGGSTDYSAAHARFFELLGGAGVADHAGDLAAQLQALQAGLALPGVGSAAAAQFDALSSANQLQQAQALVGAEVFNQAALTFIRNRDANATLTLGDALNRVAGLSALDQKALAGQALALAWTAKVPQATQLTTALALSGAAGNQYADALQSFMATRGSSSSDLGTLWTQFSALGAEQQLLLTNQVLNAELAAAGKAGSQLKGDEQLQAYARGYNALATVFPGSKSSGQVLMTSSQIKTTQNSPIEIIVPHSGIDVGAPVSTASSSKQVGVVTAGGGSVSMIVRDNLEVNTSRIFTVGKGDLLMWSSNGDIDGGKGARTVVGAPPPVTYFDAATQSFQVDTSGSFSGSGIAALDSRSQLLLFAPRGEIVAGDAGIRAAGTAYLGGTIRDPGGLEGGAAAAAPAAPAQVNAAANVQPPAATNAGNRDADEQKDENNRKKKRRNVLLDFLGFGADNEDQKP